MLRKITRRILTDKQKHKIISNRIDDISNCVLNKIVTKGGGINNFASFMSMDKKREKVKDYIHDKYSKGKRNDIFR